MKLSILSSDCGVRPIWAMTGISIYKKIVAHKKKGLCFNRCRPGLLYQAPGVPPGWLYARADNDMPNGMSATTGRPRFVPSRTAAVWWIISSTVTGSVFGITLGLNSYSESPTSMISLQVPIRQVAANGKSYAVSRAICLPSLSCLNLGNCYLFHRTPPSKNKKSLLNCRFTEG